MISCDPCKGKTIAEKILSHKSETDAYAGDIVVAQIDKAMSHDANRPLPFVSLAEMGFKEIFDPQRYYLFLDHAAPSPTETISNIHKQMRKFAVEYGVRLFDVGEGICHQLVVENGLALPGQLIIGTDSHTCTYGALNAFATGIGSADMSMALATGKQWFKVPETIQIKIEGKLPIGTYAKDLILYIIGKVGANGANYKALEFKGKGISSLTMEERFTLSNMATEMGAKTGLMEVDAITLKWITSRATEYFTPVSADDNAVYTQAIECDLNNLQPQVSVPHQVDNVVPLEQVLGTPIDQGFIGTCTNGRLTDLRVAAAILKGNKVFTGCRLLVIPASRQIMLDAISEGTMQEILQAGALLGVPGCGPCAGNHMGVPADRETVISTSNRNFKGRMGNSKANIFIGSAATVAASCITGKISDPREFLEA